MAYLAVPPPGLSGSGPVEARRHVARRELHRSVGGHGPAPGRPWRGTAAARWHCQPLPAYATSPPILQQK